MGGAAHEMQDVVLVEPDGHPDDRSDHPGSATGPDAAPSDGGPARRLRRRWGLIPAVLALVVVGASVVSDRLETARLAELQDVPGVLAPLDGPVAERWRSEIPLWPGATGATGPLVGVQEGDDGGADVVALDPRTGDVLWRTRARPPGAFDGWASCVVPDPRPPLDRAPAVPVVVCVVIDETTAYEAGAVLRPTSTRLMVLDATSGTVLGDDPTEASTTLAAIGADVVLSHVGADGRVTVTRTDARGQAHRWTFTSPDAPTDPAGQGVSVQVVDDLVVVNAVGASWVLSADGEIVHARKARSTAATGGWTEVLPGRPLVGEQLAVDSGPAATVEITDLRTGRAFTVGGYPVSAMPDDGSLADVILIRTDTGDLVGLDRRSGEPLWTNTDTNGGGVIILDGRILQDDAGQLRSLDGRTGREVWATRIEILGQSSLVTDGRLVLLTRASPDGGADLTAYGVDDGRLRWQVRIPTELYYLVNFDGRLYGWTERGIVALGADPANNAGADPARAR